MKELIKNEFDVEYIFKECFLKLNNEIKLMEKEIMNTTKGVNITRKDWINFN